MRTFLRALDRALVHIYCVAGLVIALVFFADEVAYNRAAFMVMQVQAAALIKIAEGLRGNRT
jgi:hypothetical protein